MRTKRISIIAFTAALALATALTLSCSNDSNDNNPVVISSSSNETNSSSSNEQNTSSSSLEHGSSSSGQADCEALNNYNMAVTMNLNGEPVVVTKNGSPLIEGVNYRVSTTQNSIKVNGLKDYVGSVERTNSNTSGIVVKDGNKVLAKNTDYTITETSNSVKIVGMGNYTGSVEVELLCEPPAIVPPTITTASLPYATVGTAYSKTLEATGDTPISWSIKSGNLPAGLSLSGNTISGTPTAVGTFNITIKATNAGGSDEKNFSIVVSAAAINNIMYHGYTYTTEPTTEELDYVINNRMLKPSEVTAEGKTIIFNGSDGSGYRCILIPKSIGQITSLKDALNTENLGNLGEPSRTIFRKGQITYNGTDYYFYGGDVLALDGVNTYITMSF